MFIGGFPIVSLDKVYLESVLPVKMKYNLQSIKGFNFGKDVVTMLMTVFAVLGKA